MADPISIAAVVGMAATAAGGAVSAYGSYQGGKIEKQMYDYRSKVAAQNAIYERALGERQAGIAGLQQAQRGGAIRAALGASGLDVTRGSATDVQASQLAVGRIEQENVRYNAARRAYGEQVQGQLYTEAGKQAKWAGGVKAAGTILGTTASVSSKWLQASSMGMSPGGGAPDMDLGYGMYGV